MTGNCRCAVILDDPGTTFYHLGDFPCPEPCESCEVLISVPDDYDRSAEASTTLGYDVLLPGRLVAVTSLAAEHTAERCLARRDSQMPVVD